MKDWKGADKSLSSPLEGGCEMTSQTHPSPVYEVISEPFTCKGGQAGGPNGLEQSGSAAVPPPLLLQTFCSAPEQMTLEGPWVGGGRHSPARSDPHPAPTQLSAQLVGLLRQHTPGSCLPWGAPELGGIGAGRQCEPLHSLERQQGDCISALGDNRAGERLKN